MLERARASEVVWEDHEDIPSVVTLRHERCVQTSDECWRRCRILVATAARTSTRIPSRMHATLLYYTSVLV